MQTTCQIFLQKAAKSRFWMRLSHLCSIGYAYHPIFCSASLFYWKRIWEDGIRRGARKMTGTYVHVCSCKTKSTSANQLRSATISKCPTKTTFMVINTHWFGQYTLTEPKPPSRIEREALNVWKINTSDCVNCTEIKWVMTHFYLTPKYGELPVAYFWAFETTNDYVERA